MSIPKCTAQIGSQQPPDSALRELLATVVRQCSKTHEQIAQEMSLHCGQRISKRMFDDWTSPSKKGARFPAAFIEAFCEAVSDDTLQRHVIGARLRGIVELREEQLNWLAKSLRAELLKPNRRGHRTKPKGKRRQRA